MIPRIDPPPTLLRLARRQCGVLTAEQAHAGGLQRRPIERLIAEGRWSRLDSGLYAVGEPPYEWSTLAWGGVLLGGDGARLGARSAGHRWGLVDPPPALVEVLVPDARPVRSRRYWRFLRERPGVRTAESTGSPPHLAIEATVLDLSDQLDPRGVIDLVTRAVQSRRTTVARLRSAVERRARLRHRRLLLEVLYDVGAGAESPLELRYLRDVERAHGLPRADRQESRSGGAEVRDAYYTEYRTLVELDGRRGHCGSGVLRDMQRDNRALVVGDATLRYGWDDVYGRPCAVAAQVEVVLRSRGWAGALRRCPRCPAPPRSRSA